MKQKIGLKTYDTDTAELIRTSTHGEWGDPAGYEEILYRTPDGCYFLFCRGGETSPYPTERIKRVAKANVAKYLGENN